ncbi:NAD-dependent succinate-semialdehyde dehydrogenase [Microvirga puerhi]|uniref:NAD-dependent succinate-semialdehyde dehydrogenase n=1 Tax=Microvirga puerhi TaxID=2876078 RepID=A0ABS7VNV8_9HYPH|nr:NAD-dependent succinate-semialdehyde dehydrogenase [Microvirga puerhi]MBZ6077189.1 NAD-dependent succinate-semialdehyde dehydrogenase [Microvirga puerhi]
MAESSLSDRRSSASARPRFETIDPSTGKPGRQYEGHTVAEAVEIARQARKAFESWRSMSFADRAGLMHEAARVLRRRKEEFAEIMTAEMGKLIADGRAEIEKCAFNCDYFADNAETFLSRRPVDFEGHKAFVTFNPIGTVLAIMPWNFPFWQVFRFAAPTLMAGNTAVLKHASNVPGSALAIESVFRDAGFPEHVFRTLLIPSASVQTLIEDPAIAAVTLTGSVEAGRRVASAAGAALKKSVLELGGSDAYLVLEDADVAAAAKVCATARMVNGGQSCIAGKRFIVVRSVREALERSLTSEMERYAMGDPRSTDTKLGPMESVKARDQIHDQVRRSLDKGARLLTGGQIPDRPGAWYPPTILTNVQPGMPAYDDEVFGPVAAIIEAEDEDDAIRIANGSAFGLGSGVLTRDLARGERIAADALEAGMSFVNGNVRSDPRMPFGGVKHSGYGRECSDLGIHEFVNIKSVVVFP